MNIPILVDAEQERRKEELEGLLVLASYIVCSGKFPKVLLQNHEAFHFKRHEYSRFR
jgi:hypothetical protein